MAGVQFVVSLFLVVSVHEGALGADCSHPDAYKCGGDGRTCVWLDVWCNGHSDCPNYADEYPAADCESFCMNQTERFQCFGGRGTQCIVANWRCDGDRDCHDGSDEWNCETFCSQTTDRFQCGGNDAKCLPLYWRCNDRRDCSDNSDEEGCDLFCAQSPERFQCAGSESHCIHTAFRCNGIRGCPDDSDEWGCQANCSSSHVFQCANSSRCFDTKYRCDGSVDCPEGSDELECEEYCQNQGQGVCGNSSQCLDFASRCDGTLHCRNDADEQNCEEVCHGRQGFLCANTTVCLSMAVRCDGIDQCPRADDEQLCEEWCRQTGGYLCPHSNKCINMTSVCDHHVDCPGGREEIECVEESTEVNTVESKTGLLSAQIVGIITGFLLLFVIIVIAAVVVIRVHKSRDQRYTSLRTSGRRYNVFRAIQNTYQQHHHQQRSPAVSAVRWEMSPPPPLPPLPSQHRHVLGTDSPASVDHVYERVGTGDDFEDVSLSSSYEEPYAVPNEAFQDDEDPSPQSQATTDTSLPPNNLHINLSLEDGADDIQPVAPSPGQLIPTVSPLQTSEQLQSHYIRSVPSPEEFPQDGNHRIVSSSSAYVASGADHPRTSTPVLVDAEYLPIISSVENLSSHGLYSIPTSVRPEDAASYTALQTSAVSPLLADDSYGTGCQSSTGTGSIGSLASSLTLASLPSDYLHAIPSSADLSPEGPQLDIPSSGIPSVSICVSSTDLPSDGLHLSDSSSGVPSVSITLSSNVLPSDGLHFNNPSSGVSSESICLSSSDRHSGGILLSSSEGWSGNMIPTSDPPSGGTVLSSSDRLSGGAMLLSDPSLRGTLSPDHSSGGVMSQCDLSS